MVIFERAPGNNWIYMQRPWLKWWTHRRWEVWRLREAGGRGRGHVFGVVWFCPLDEMGAFVHCDRQAAPVSPLEVAAGIRLATRTLLRDHPMLLCTVPEDNPRMLRLLAVLGFRTLARYDDGVEPGRVFRLLARWRDGAPLVRVPAWTGIFPDRAALGGAKAPGGV